MEISSVKLKNKRKRQVHDHLNDEDGQEKS